MVTFGPPTVYWRVSAGRTVCDTNTGTDTINKIKFFEHNVCDVIHCVHRHMHTQCDRQDSLLHMPFEGNTGRSKKRSSALT
jgi:hypothetical protein